MSARIILAADHRILREGLSALLAKTVGFEIIAHAEDGRAAVALAQKHLPDVVIIDVTMPGLNGIESTRQILEHKAGASGYLLKDAAFEELASAVKVVLGGETYLSPKISKSVVLDYIQRLGKDASNAPAELTPRERQVLQLLAEGRSTKEIASELDLSVKTADFHRQNIMSKLKLHSVAELTKYAVRQGLTPLE